MLEIKTISGETMKEKWWALWAGLEISVRRKMSQRFANPHELSIYSYVLFSFFFLRTNWQLNPTSLTYGGRWLEEFSVQPSGWSSDVGRRRLMGTGGERKKRMWLLPGEVTIRLMAVTEPRRRGLSTEGLVGSFPLLIPKLKSADDSLLLVRVAVAELLIVESRLDHGSDLNRTRTRTNNPQWVNNIAQILHIFHFCTSSQHTKGGPGTFIYLLSGKEQFSKMAVVMYEIWMRHPSRAQKSNSEMGNMFLSISHRENNLCNTQSDVIMPRALQRLMKAYFVECVYQTLEHLYVTSFCSKVWIFERVWNTHYYPNALSYMLRII